MNATRHRLALLALLAVAAVVAAGCGGSSSGLGDALNFVPKDAPIVIAVKTDTASTQYKNIRTILSRFPGGSQVGQLIAGSFNRSGAGNFNQDIKPILGNDLVLAAPTPQALRGQSKLIIALKAKDEGKAAAFLKHQGTKIGTSHGTDVYRSNTGQDVFAMQNGVIVQAPSQGDLDTSLGGSDHMSTSDFNARVAAIPADALVRVGGDFQALISQSASGGAARRVPWVNALETFGVAIGAQQDGVAIDFNVKTQGVSASDLPLAAGAGSPPVVRRTGEIGLGVRGFDQTIRFIVGAAQAVNPASIARLNSALGQIGTRYGVDVQRDVFGQLSGNSTLSVGLDGGFAIRTELPNPAGFRSTLAKLAPALPQFARGAGIRNAALVKPGHGNPFYALAGSNGKRYVFGVVGAAFVLATDPTRAAQFATEAPVPVPGATGAVSILADGHAVGAEILKRLKQQSPAAQLFLQPIGDLTGYVSSSANGLRGHLKLAIH